MKKSLLHLLTIIISLHILRKRDSALRITKLHSHNVGKTYGFTALRRQHIMYNTVAIAEDRATLGSDPSAVTVAYSIGRYQKGYRYSFVKARGELKNMLVSLMR